MIVWIPDPDFFLAPPIAQGYNALVDSLAPTFLREATP